MTCEMNCKLDDDGKRRFYSSGADDRLECSCATTIPTTMPVMASDTAALVEAMARALYEEADVWHLEFPWPTNDTADEYRRLATVAYNALRDTLVPVLWLYERPGFRAISEDRYPPGVMANAVSTATEEPLYTLPELKP